MVPRRVNDKAFLPTAPAPPGLFLAARPPKRRTERAAAKPQTFHGHGERNAPAGRRMGRWESVGGLPCGADTKVHEEQGALVRPGERRTENGEQNAPTGRRVEWCARAFRSHRRQGRRSRLQPLWLLQASKPLSFQASNCTCTPGTSATCQKDSAVGRIGRIGRIGRGYAGGLPKTKAWRAKPAMPLQAPGPDVRLVRTHGPLPASCSLCPLWFLKTHWQSCVR